MAINESFIIEVQEEAKSSRKLLERVPEKSFDWKPNEKSMLLSRLASHVAEIPGWVHFTLDYNEIDFGKFDYKPPVINTVKDLLDIQEKNLNLALESFKNAKDEVFFQNWTMRNNEQVYFTLPKIAVLRSFAFNHMYHHRGQLTVYLRLLDIPLPGIYGPTADDSMM
jgi:uncharacterized damage-inducible protein DinB